VLVRRIVAGVVATAAILVLASDNQESSHLSRAGVKHTGSYTCTYAQPEHVDTESFRLDMDEGTLYCYDN
jgi:hypothetical protein